MEEETNKLTTEEIDKMLDLTSDEESDANPNPNEYLSNQGTSAGVSKIAIYFEFADRLEKATD